MSLVARVLSLFDEALDWPEDPLLTDDRAIADRSTDPVSSEAFGEQRRVPTGW